MKMPRDEARVRRCSKKASPKRSTIKCVRHPGRARRATNQSHNSRARRSLATCEVLRGLTYPAARARDDDDLVFDSRHEVLLSSLSELKAPSLNAERAVC